MFLLILCKKCFTYKTYKVKCSIHIKLEKNRLKTHLNRVPKRNIYVLTFSHMCVYVCMCLYTHINRFVYVIDSKFYIIKYSMDSVQLNGHSCPFQYISILSSDQNRISIPVMPFIVNCGLFCLPQIRGNWTFICFSLWFIDRSN